MQQVQRCRVKRFSLVPRLLVAASVLKTRFYVQRRNISSGEAWERGYIGLPVPQLGWVTLETTDLIIVV